MAAKKRVRKEWDIQKKIANAISQRELLADDMKPLFDHLLNLARDAHKRGNNIRAGREISMAKRMTSKSRYLKDPDSVLKKLRW